MTCTYYSQSSWNSRSYARPVETSSHEGTDDSSTLVLGSVGMICVLDQAWHDLPFVVGKGRRRCEVEADEEREITARVLCSRVRQL